jgi:hypothetical protein
MHQVIVEVMLEELGRTPEGWASAIFGWVRRLEDGQWRLTLIGQRVIEKETDTFWRVSVPLEPSLVMRQRYIEEKVREAYERLMSFTNCGCRPAGIKWHPDEDGDRTVPEYLTNRCEEHS